MTAWTDYQLDALSGADEIYLKSRREDGSLRPAVIVWVVAVGNDLYVRSGGGRDNPWFQRALVQHRGRISGGGIEEDVVFEEAGSSLTEKIDAAYRLKYARYSDDYVDPVVSADAADATFRLVPADED
ncbi:DUF2255 family protein [Lacisediminihabitans changchengi]|uniref:DUF2255 family protein n=1 Tax=Lacisediminihabitans changchengi TaxID=2787634 RepID=A0A934SNM6_9MICO|nr:DUF2255 family protein [Lacisediminihabitans changchengi]MBK4346268.1 DUF2255 family protein [Lacisediminihabitans changchengi]